MLPEDMSAVESNKKAAMLRLEDPIYMPRTPKDLAQLIYWFFVLKEPTFKNKDCTNTQTISGRSRSIEDLFLLSRTYFPKISYLKLEARVQSLYAENHAYYGLEHHRCADVKREVHYPSHAALTLEWIREKLLNNLEVKKK